MSEYHACKRLLYSTVGDSNEKVEIITSFIIFGFPLTMSKILERCFNLMMKTNLDGRCIKVCQSIYQVWDIFLLLPSFVFLLILGYSSPRTRQQVKLSIDRIETMLVVEKRSCDDNHGCDYSTFQLAKAPSILPKTLHLLILTGGVGFCFLSQQNFLAIS